MERKLNITAYIIILILITNVLLYRSFETFYQWFGLHADSLSKGYIWQFVTYKLFDFSILRYGQGINPLNMLFYFFFMMIFYRFGSAVEEIFESKHYIIFILLAVIPYSILSYIFGNLPLPREISSLFSNSIMVSILVAYGFQFPEERIYMLLFIPVKVKWIGIFLLSYIFITGIGKVINYPHIITVLLAFSPYTGIIIYYKKIFGPGNFRRGIKKIRKKLDKRNPISEVKIRLTDKKNEIAYSQFMMLKEKIDANRRLNKEDKEFIESLKKKKGKGTMCIEEDFLDDPGFCKKCDLFHKCVLRFINKNDK